jgi:proteasome assembly chaperone (PAC2) family protein
VAPVSELTWHEARTLDRPVLVVAFAGLFDTASVATGAVEWLVEHLNASPLASIDPEGFLDFQQARPRVELTPEGKRRVVWPQIVAHATGRQGEGQRDLVLLSGIEPHYRWRTFTELVLEIATGAGVEMIVTLGATPAQAPHTRPPVVFGSSTNAELVSRLGLSRPQYQGVTGVLGVLQASLDHDGPPAIAMRVGAPHYAMNDRNPQSIMALLRHLEHVTGVPTLHAQLGPEVTQWEQRLDTAVAEDPDASAYVRQLEAHYDSQTEQQVTSGDDLADEVERFLREQRGDT